MESNSTQEMVVKNVVKVTISQKKGDTSVTSALVGTLRMAKEKAYETIAKVSVCILC